ncbi:dNDP-4-keto-6-deoxy-glucose-2,3- dehydratase [Alphaproteobacteria bacterium]|nr:dNDP-4-keto-6-deoxy-glucose-2,3- dehydratase [Alphaproteobacteria bacterium]
MKGKYSIPLLFYRSWANLEGISSIDDLLDWINFLNKISSVDIRKITLSDSCFWFFDKYSGQIINKNKGFFRISGLKYEKANGECIGQPIIIQDEIGYLGILCKVINGSLYFLMQAKIEPGNINKIQLSPTLQATKSNFTQKHGGKKPDFLDFFINASKHTIIVDQLQSEQSSRFFKKRNRNIIVMVSEETIVEIPQSYKWLTLGQIKTLMRYNNLINMDTRTVLSCIPYSSFRLTDDERKEVHKLFKDQALFLSIVENETENPDSRVYSYINNHKMFSETSAILTPLGDLKDWVITNDEIICTHPYPFKVVFCDITIDGREVKKWTQPMLEASGKAFFGLFTAVFNGVRKFLVHAQDEIGCFDKIELGPSVQLEFRCCDKNWNVIEKLFFKKYLEKKDILYDVILSEEGGRFFHEQNNNAIIELDESELVENKLVQPSVNFRNNAETLPEGYFWLTYNTLNRYIQYNNCLNIQLRNLLSLMEI